MFAASKRKLISGVFLVVFLVGGGFSLAGETVQLPYTLARNNGMGGMHAALADDFSVLYNNSAGFVTAEPELHIADLSFHLQGPVFTMADAIMANELTKIFTEGLARHVGLGIQGPISFGYVGRGLGFGIHNYTDTKISVTSTTQPAHVEVSENFLLSGGYSIRMPLPQEAPVTLDLGFLFKGFVETGITIEKDILDVMGLFSSLSPALLLEEPYYLQTGIGIDVGLLSSLYEQFFLGLTVRDLYSPTKKNIYGGFGDFQAGSAPDEVENGIIPLDLSVGLMWQPLISSSNQYINEFRLMLDYKDLLDFVVAPQDAVNPVLHVGAGAEAVMLDILALRVGMDQGLLNAGVGLDLYFFQLNAAMYGTEMGIEPGMDPVYNMMVSLEFSL